MAKLRATRLNQPELSALVNLVDTIREHLTGRCHYDQVEALYSPRYQRTREDNILMFLNLHEDVMFQRERERRGGQ